MILADRSVTVRLSADVKPFISQMAKAEAAAKRLRDGLGDSWEPFERQTQKQKQRAPKQAEEVAGAFVRTFTRHIAAAAKSLPSLELSANTSDAQIKLASLRQGLVDLADRRINVDISAASALGELRAIQMELERVGTSAEIDVRADAAAALAQLQVVQREVDRLGGETARVEVDADTRGAQAGLRSVASEVSRLDGRTARVAIHADGSRALLAIAAVAGALASLPAVTTLAVGVSVLGAGFAAAGAGALAFAAAAVPGIGRVNEALAETESAAGGAGGAMKSAAQKAAEAAASALSMAQAQDRVRDAAHGVRMAQRGVGDALRDVKDRQDALRQAQESAGLAAERVSLVAEAGARRVADAERTAADAHRATQRALEDLTRARERALERLEDLALATEGGALSEERAQISIRRAQADLARINAPGSKASSLDKEDAELRVREAEFALKRLKEGNADLAAESAKANREGVEGSDEVRRAKEAVEAATRREADAERAVSDARTQAARDVAAAQREARQASDAVARAQRDVSDALRDVADAQYAVSQAERDQLRAKQQLRLEQLQQKAAIEQTGSAAGGAASKMAELSKEERKLAEDITRFKDAYKEWQQSLQGDTFPVVSKTLDLLERGLPRISPLVRGTSAAFSTLLDDIETAMTDPFWDTFLYKVGTYAPGAIVGLGRSFGNVVEGIAGVIEAFLPWTPTVVGGLESATERWATWGKALKDSPEFHEFLLFVRENAPKVWEFIQNIASALVHVGESLVPLGVGTMAGINLLAQILAGMNPQHIQLIALAIVAIKTAQAGLKVASFFSDIGGAVDRGRTKLSGFGDAMDRVKGKSSGLAGSIGGLAGGLGGLAGIVGGAALAGGLLVLEQRLASNAEAAGRFVEKTAALGGGNIDAQIAAVTRAIQEQRDQLGFAILDTIYFSDAERAAADNVEALEAKLVGLQHQKELDAIASRTAGDAAGGHAQRVNDLNKSLDTFAARTDALQAVRNMETAYKDAAAALEASNGKLDFNARMTDKQRDAVILAREAFGGYLEKVATGAEAQEKLSGRTGDATIKVAEQLPRLMELAGKSAEAREQVYQLAEKFGLSRQMADKAALGSKGFKEELDKLKDKQVKIELDTKKALDQAYAFAKQLLGIKLELPVGIKAPAAPRAYGGIYDSAGRQYMASGGIRSVGSNPSAMIASSPYMISGRAGPDVVFGEAGMEAYIPLSSGKRDRGLRILQQAAGIMGMAVVPEQVGANTVRAASGGGGSSFPGSGAASVTITGIDALRSSIDTTAAGLTASLGVSTSTLDAALGDAGTLTGAVDELGQAATSWGEVIAVEVPPLTEAVSQLGDAISAVAAAGGSKGGAGSKGDERSPRSSGSKKAAAASIAIQGATSGTAGVALSGSPNWSRQSRPVQAPPSASGGSGGGSSGGGGELALGASQQLAGSLVHVGTLAVTEKADVDQVAAALYSRLGSKGR